MRSCFEQFFQAATGYTPHGYQARIARDGLPDVVKAPTGTGKTGVVLAWLWRRLSAEHRDATPRRLIYALPRGGLVDQVAGEARKWLANLGLTDDVALHVVLGARDLGTTDFPYFAVLVPAGGAVAHLHRGDVVAAAHDRLPDEEAGRQLDVVPRRPHRHGERGPAHPDPQRLLGGEQVGPRRGRGARGPAGTVRVRRGHRDP